MASRSASNDRLDPALRHNAMKDIKSKRKIQGLAKVHQQCMFSTMCA